MHKIEEIQRYIDRAKTDRYSRYCMYLDEADAIYDLFQRNPYTAIELAFGYGKAKGYRMAKAESGA